MISTQHSVEFAVYFPCSIPCLLQAVGVPVLGGMAIGMTIAPETKSW